MPERAKPAALFFFGAAILLVAALVFGVMIGRRRAPLPPPPREVKPPDPFAAIEEAVDRYAEVERDVHARYDYLDLEADDVWLAADLAEELLHAASDAEREGMLWGLASIGPGARDVLPGVRAYEEDANAGVRIASRVAAAVLAENPGEVVPWVVGQVGKEEAALRALLVLGPEHAEAAVPVLAKLLADPERRGSAALHLSFFGPRAAPALPALLAALEEPYDYGDEPASLLDAIAAIGPAAREALPTVEKWVREHGEDLEEGAAARVAAWTLQPDSTRHRDAVVDALSRARSLDLYYLYAEAFGYAGEAALPALPRLREMLRNEDFYVCYGACFALQRMERRGAAAQPELIELVRAPNDDGIRGEAAMTLAAVAEKSAPVVDALVALVGDATNARDRLQAAHALLTLRADSGAVLDALRKSMTAEEDPEAKVELANVLRRIDERARWRAGKRPG